MFWGQHLSSASAVRRAGRVKHLQFQWHSQAARGEDPDSGFDFRSLRFCFKMKLCIPHRRGEHNPLTPPNLPQSQGKGPALAPLARAGTSL